jgi:hypothetical protein
MIIKEYKDLDTCGKTRLYVEVECDVCQAIFKRQKRQLNKHICSNKCASIVRGSTIIVNCAHCNKEIHKAKSDINGSKSGLLFCNRKCKEAAQKYNVLIQPSHYGAGESDYRQRALKHYGAECQKCGFDKNPKALDVHHKDQNRANNTIENLEVLCCNCHAIEHR